MKPVARVLTTSSTIEQGYAFFLLHKHAAGLSEATITATNSFYTAFNRFLRASGKDASTIPLSIFHGEEAFDTLFRTFLEERGYRPSTIHTYMSQYKAFITYLADEVKILPHRRIKLKAPPQTVKNLFTAEQLRALLTPPKDLTNFYHYQNYVITHFVLNTGCRVGNVVGLTLGDCVRMDEGIIRFPTTKNGKPQLIFVPAPTVAVLKKWISVWRSDAAADDYVFCDKEGNKRTTRAVYNRFGEYVKRMAGENCPHSIHLLRHQYAATFLRNGGSIYDLKRQLGHSTFAMVEWYANHFADPNVDNMEQFTPIFTMEKKDKLKPHLGKKKKGEDD